MLTINKEGNWDIPQSKIIEEAMNFASEDPGKLPPELIRMAGMSGKNYRTFINKVVELTPDARYLEIGSWQGSTACSAAYGNSVKVTCIDNWYQGDGIKTNFLENVKKFMTENVKFFYEHNNFYEVNYHDIGKYNLYMFDGPHEKEDHYAGIKLAQPALDDIFTLIIDDYNASQVVEGTQDAIRDLNLEVLSSMTILTGHNPYLTPTDWHNGYYIAVIKKGQQ